MLSLQHKISIALWALTTLVVALLAPSVYAAAANGTLRLAIDTPNALTPVALPFAVAGWTLDQSAASSTTGIDAVHVYARPVVGTPIFLGAAELGRDRPDVAAAFGAGYLRS